MKHEHIELYSALWGALAQILRIARHWKNKKNQNVIALIGEVGTAALSAEIVVLLLLDNATLPDRSMAVAAVLAGWTGATALNKLSEWGGQLLDLMAKNRMKDGDKE